MGYASASLRANDRGFSEYVRNKTCLFHRNGLFQQPEVQEIKHKKYFVTYQNEAEQSLLQGDDALTNQLSAPPDLSEPSSEEIKIE